MSELKVTIKKKEDVVNIPCLKDVQPGEVFKFVNGAGSILLKLRQKELVVIKTNGFNFIFDCYGNGWPDNSLVQILGKVTEIIVDPNV